MEFLFQMRNTKKEKKLATIVLNLIEIPKDVIFVGVTCR
jgi:hypothetical protein